MTLSFFRQAAAWALGFATAVSAQADVVSYANVGQENPLLYTFTAAADGNITAYFMSGQRAGYTNELTMLVNGVATGVQGLNNHASAPGASLVLGNVRAGDRIIFEMFNIAPGNVGPWYSEKSMNVDGVNHVYSTKFAGNNLVPAGTYVAFEDLRNGGDFNYNDLAFVFTNIAASSSTVPEPGSLALLGVAAVAGGAVRRVQRRSQPLSA